MNKEIFEQSKNVGKKIVELGNNKKSFGSFVKIYDNEDLMKIFPWIEQGLWNFPMNKNFRIMFKNYHEDLTNIDNCDLSILFVHQFGDSDKVFLKHEKNNIYHCVIQSKTIESLKKNYADIITGFCQDNPFVKMYNDKVNKVALN